MPLINEAYSFSVEEKNLIDELLKKGFIYKDWGTEALQGIRSSIRRFYRDAQGGRCPYCMKTVSLLTPGNAHIEHILPKSLFSNFIFEPRNLCVICADCNTAKNNGNTINEDEENTCNGSATIYPRAENRFKIIHPHIDEYNDHILRAGIFYIDKSPKGHFTIGICKLNIATRAFGHEEGVLDDFEFFQMMQKYLTGSDAERREVFTAMRNIIPRPLP
ncbi:HNH endonuclease [Pseudomonas chengduensis]|nr:HNH endonuclease [Pseudomonas chengduensis]MBG0844114.1 HNH endonuclease [Pseudomonas chengduensis]